MDCILNEKGSNARYKWRHYNGKIIERKTLDHKNIITLRLTDIELAYLDQIAKHLNQGGVRSMILQDRVHECIDKLFDLRQQVMELGGDYYGDIEAQDK